MILTDYSTLCLIKRTNRMNVSTNNQKCEADDIDSISSQSSSSYSDHSIQPNWELLNETLGPGSIEALKSHLMEQSNSCNDDIPNDDNRTENMNETSIANPIDHIDSSCMELPRCNKEYGKHEYWEERFAKEQEYEWLVSYKDVSQLLQPYLTSQSHQILIVGCGNSSFSSDIYDAGYKNITNIDYSTNVIEMMKSKHEIKRPDMKWVVMDMTNMSFFSDESFDIVIDKAAMDALMTQEGDVWNPNQDVVDSSRNMCRHISRILKSGGYHLHISFAQPHFRKKYLLGLHPLGDDVAPIMGRGGRRMHSDKENDYSDEFGWDLQVKTIGGDDDNDGCFHHFLYIMHKI